MIHNKKINQKFYEAGIESEYVNLGDKVKSRWDRNEVLYLTEEAAMIALKTVLEDFAPVDAIYTMPEEISDFIYIEIERAWTVGANISIRFQNDRKLFETETGKLMVSFCKLRTEITWSSTGRTVEQAQACIDLYQEMVNLARTLEVSFEGMGVYQDHKEIETNNEPVEK